MNEKKRTIAFIFAIVMILGAIFYFQTLGSDMKKPFSSINIGRTTEGKSGKYPQAKEIVNPSGFINANPFGLKDLIGKKVILVDFWTYSCINCQRTMPYLNAWYEKYGDKGLEIVGIHSPEFEFEKDYDNVVRAVEKFGVSYPVVLDNDFSTWRAYGNRYWPRKYLIDIDGYVVYDHIGEGGYEETEEKIQELLRERTERLGAVSETLGGSVFPPNAPRVDASRIGSPEIYFGSARNAFLGNGTPLPSEQNFVFPEERELNVLYLEGRWKFTPEYAENAGKAKIAFRYDSKDVYFVAEALDPVNIRIFRDGNFVDEIQVSDSSLYTLVKGVEYEEHLLEIEVDNAGLRAFTFTFG